MAKLTGPLMSFQARGSFGPRLTYSERKSGSQMRWQRAQADHITPARTTQRSFFIMAVSWWNQLNKSEQDEWDTIARYDC